MNEVRFQNRAKLFNQDMEQQLAYHYEEISQTVQTFSQKLKIY